MTLKISIGFRRLRERNERKSYEMVFVALEISTISRIIFTRFHVSFINSLYLFGLIIASYKFPVSLIDFLILFRNFVLPKSNRPVPVGFSPTSLLLLGFSDFTPPRLARLLHDYIENRSCASATASQPERSTPARGVLSTV